MMSSPIRILITGGNRGLGLAYAKALLASPKSGSYRILITARSEERAREAAKELDAERVKGYGCDIENQEQVEALAKRLETEEGQVDVLINNAGVALDGYAQKGEMSWRDAWNQSYSINVTSNHLFTYAFIPLLLKSPAPKIIFISSRVGSITNQVEGVLGEMDAPRSAGWPKAPGFNPTAYRSTKAAFNMMCREWHRTLVNDGVKVYILAMDGYATEFAGQDAAKALADGGNDPKIAGEWVRGFVEGDHEGEEGKYIALHGEIPW